ncbi:RibD family protein [Scytonema sp. NUACC26]|uniref:RibD family protein n=1 Tax=Scytonema sp. NUACC26 TaxID=3140176 RepID=UPI0038B26D6F
MQDRPHTIVILAMSADGKISDVTRSPARFGSKTDKAHLEEQIALVDAVIFGAGTLRAYGTTLTVSHPQLLQQRDRAGKPPQPIQIVITHSARINPEIRFFRQKISRWLLTTSPGSLGWQNSSGFEKILVFEKPTGEIDLEAGLKHLRTVGIKRLAVLGGGELVSSMLTMDLIDEFWLTICPLIVGGAAAPTPVQGDGFLPELAPSLQLLEVRTIEQEVFLHYFLKRSKE